MVNASSYENLAASKLYFTLNYALPSSPSDSKKIEETEFLYLRSFRTLKAFSIPKAMFVPP